MALFFQWCTCLGVASSVAHSLQSWYHDALIMVGVQLELSLGVITELHKWNLFKEKQTIEYIIKHIKALVRSGIFKKINTKNEK